jgi:hypothetical protein
MIVPDPDINLKMLKKGLEVIPVFSWPGLMGRFLIRNDLKVGSGA